MNGCELSKALHEGQRVYGTLLVSAGPQWPVAVRSLGLDFVFIDTEHVALDRSQLSWMCRAYGAMNLAPLVRITSPDPYQACTALDGGAAGVIAPYIETVEQVRRLAGAVKYRPLKGKKLASFLFNDEKLEPALLQQIEESNKSNVLIANIESVPAMEALDDILAVPGLDAVFIGPHDLTHSLGIPLQYNHPKYEAAVEEIIQKARARNVGAGIHACYPNSMEQEIKWVTGGANFVVHSGDIQVFTAAMKSDIDAIKKAVGDISGSAEDADINI